MGSKFLNPMSVIDFPGRILGSNSTLAKWQHYDPLMGDNGLGLGKYIAPNTYQKGVDYGRRQQDPNPQWTAQNRPTPFAGQDPTLRDANAGYVTAANNAVNQANKTWQQGSQGNPYGQ